MTDDDGEPGLATATVTVNRPPDCRTVRPSPDSLWPPNHALRTVALAGATDPDGDPVTLTVTGVTQDEPLDGLGDGDTAPDAALVPGLSHQVRLRAERSGKGDGRVYRVSFEGSDGHGGTCSATVSVIVVRDRGRDSAVDSGLNLDSL